MTPVKVKPNTNGDTRVATSVPNFTDFNTANNSHRNEAGKMMASFAEDIRLRGNTHDYTKDREPYRSMFYRDLCNTIEGRIKFEDGEWNKIHYAEERHHLLKRVPDDVNLIDVIEMIADCVCAGMARSGNVRPLEIDESILKTALANTVTMMANAVVMDQIVAPA